MRAILKIASWLLILVIVTVSSMVHAATLPNFQKVRAEYQASFSTLLDRNREVLQTLQIDPKVQRLPWVTLQELSPAMLDALLVSEDQRFFEHAGVDWRAMLGAAWENLMHNTHRGASTLTMQLAGLLDPSLTRGAGGRTYLQKWQQINAARQLERHWSKAQILEAYLNLVDYRSNLYGLNAASSALFNKPPIAINPTEASILSALLRGPNARPAIVAERACGVAKLLHPPKPNCAEITALSTKYLVTHPKTQFTVAIAPDAAKILLNTPGQRLVSSLDSQLQTIALNNLHNTLTPTASAAAVILDNATGELLAYINNNPSRNNIVTPHPAASLLQPFVYGLAIEQKQLTAASIVDNTPVPITTNPLYPDYLTNLPEHHWVSVRTALSSGLHAAARRISTLLAPNDYADRLRALGLASEESQTLLALANAYQAIANNGSYCAASFHVGGLNNPQRIMPVRVAVILGDILSNEPAYSLIQGIDFNNYYSAIHDQHYAAGFTENYTIAVWTDDPTGTVAAIWQNITNDILRTRPSHPPKLPNNIVIQNVRYLPPIEPPRPELFLPGTEQSQFYIPPTRTEAQFSQPDVSYPSLNY